jgi:hypothetical protein
LMNGLIERVSGIISRSQPDQACARTVHVTSISFKDCGECRLWYNRPRQKT